MKIVVVGSGSIGKRHMGNLIAKGFAPGEIHAVDPRPDRRAEVASRLGITQTHSSFEELIGLGAEIVVIASPTSMHLEHAARFAETGATLLIEKPLDASLEGLDELQGAIARGGSKVLVAYPFRFSPAGRKLKELSDGNAAGRPLYLRGEFSEYLPDWHPWEDYREFYMAKVALGGGSLLDQSHIMDLAHWLLGEVEGVFGYSGRVSDLEVETDDLAEIQVRFRSGVIATIHQDMFGRRHQKLLEIKGTLGNITWNAYDFSVELFLRAAGETRRWEFAKDHQVMYHALIDHLLQVHQGEQAPGCTLDEAIHGMRIIEAVRRSAVSLRQETLEAS